ncbi:hypothetical protein [Chamaesiphon sp. VAR_69_metabat_338]|uniref:hypothetical protein n=1 Tax=Chamaesiphon sp. VAR_69_metabat_338 TaxID=2964704 RepID=UPI00286DAE2F|nr:hypothetical protein [Chamaesiphon sp. VAR_69_metabat_338]
MRHIKLSLLISLSLLTASWPACAHQLSGSQQQRSIATSRVLIADVTSTDFISGGITLLNNLLNPPHRSAEINADTEIRKAKIAAEAEIAKERMRIEANRNTDRVTPVLNQWGVARTNCAPGLVFINGLTTDTVCIKPSQTIVAGYYDYDSAKQQLVKTISTTQIVQSKPIMSTINAARDRGF